MPPMPPPCATSCLLFASVAEVTFGAGVSLKEAFEQAPSTPLVKAVVAVNISAAKPVFNEIGFIELISLKWPFIFSFSHINEIRMKFWRRNCKELLHYPRSHSTLRFTELT